MFLCTAVVIEYKILLYCAKRSFPSVVPENLLSVRFGSVRSFVRIIIVFCEEDLGVARMLLSTGSLNLRFFRIQKVNTQK